MNLRPVHQNLDTSYVNLAALVEHLRGRDFEGIVRVRFTEYEAEIHLRGQDEIIVREREQLSDGAAAEENSLERVMAQARKAGGTIGVFQSSAEKTPRKFSPKDLPEIGSKPSAEPVHDNSGKPSAEPLLKFPTPKTVPTPQSKPAKTGRRRPPEITKANVLSFPFSLTGSFASKAKPAKISAARFQTVVRLAGEILRAIDEPLAAARLDFPAALETACSEISGDYPFLEPASGLFRYRSGDLILNDRVNPDQFISGLLEAGRRVLERLAANPSHAKTHRAAAHNLIAFVNRQKDLCDEFSITRKIERITGTSP